VNYYSGPGNLGLYSTAYGVAELFWYFTDSIGAALSPKIPKLDPLIASRVTAQTTRQALMIGFPVALLFGLAGVFLIPWAYSDRFRPSVIPFLYLLPGIISMVVTKIISADLNGRGKTQYTTYASVATVFLILVLDIILIPRFGIAGAAIAASIAYITSSIMMVTFFRRETGLPLRQILILNRQNLLFMTRRSFTWVAWIRTQLKKWLRPVRDTQNTEIPQTPPARTSFLQLRMIYTFRPDEERSPHSVPTGYRLVHYQPEFETAWVQLLNESREFSKFTTQTLWTEILSGLIPEGGVFIEYQGKLVAAAAVCYRKEVAPHAVLMYVIVLPEHRGLGLGKIVTNQVMAAARQAGYPGMVLYTDDGRLPAIQMYLGLGFQPDLETQIDTQERWQRVLQRIRVEIRGKGTAKQNDENMFPG
jgi:ribosomal protein S18 acetylase RimI-like enzyme